MLNLGSRSFTKESRDNHFKTNNNKTSLALSNTLEGLTKFEEKQAMQWRKKLSEKNGGKAKIGCAYQGCS